ncbi:MAG: hypothetical protein RL685_148 [Pseudomonadota bacterium]|jgi:hypothetical protein
MSGAKPWLRAVLLCLLAGRLAPAREADAAPAQAAEERRRVAVRVVEVAGGRAYLAPGAEQHVRVGDRVRIGSAEYVVVARNSKTFAIDPGQRRLTPGQRGFVRVRVAAAETFASRERPRPLTAFAPHWRAPRLPAESQTPRFVPLGTLSDARRSRLVLQVDHQRIEPLSGQAASISRTRLRARLHAELSALPLTLDADGVSELWQADDLAERPGNAARPSLQLRQLELGYRGEVVQGALGRLRYASSTLGMLDGGRVSARLGSDFSVAAFGGTLPGALDGSYASDASRYGTELTWQPSAAAARPRASLTLHGSSYQGRSDERRISGLVEAYPELGRLGAHAQVSLYDAENPWAAATTELSSAGVDASVQLDDVRLGAAFDARRPERSLWLAAFLPAGYFCAQRPIAGAAAVEPCLGGDLRYSALLNAAWLGSNWTLDAATTLTTTRPAVAEQMTAFLHFERRDLFGALRLDAGASASHGSVLDSAALELGSGVRLGEETGDASLYYRPSVLRYRADADPFLEHGFGGRFWGALAPQLDLSGAAELVTGRDVDVLLLQLGLAWTPRF